MGKRFLRILVFESNFLCFTFFLGKNYLNLDDISKRHQFLLASRNADILCTSHNLVVVG